MESLQNAKYYRNYSRLYAGRLSLALEDDDYPLELKECSMNFIECRVEKFLLMMGCPLLIALSLVGNSVTFSVMMRPKLRNTATATFIAVLAIMDTTANLTGLTRHFILKTWQIDVRQLSAISCSTHRFILYLSLDTSAWLLAFITIERFIAVCRPEKHKTIKSAKTAWKAVLCLILIQIAFNIHVFWTRGQHWTQLTDAPIINVQTQHVVALNCGYPSKSSRTFWANHQGWLSMLWYCFIPFTTMLVLNIFIIRRLKRLKDRSLGRNSSGLSSTGITKQANSMTRMLLAVTLYFMVVTTPVFVFTMFQSLLFYSNAGGTVTEHRIAKLELVDASLTILLYLNHSINFFLYCFAGRRFRRELKSMFGCLKNGNRIKSVRKPSVKCKPVADTACREHLKTHYEGMTTGSSPMLVRSDATATTAAVNISGL